MSEVCVSQGRPALRPAGDGAGTRRRAAVLPVRSGRVFLPMLHGRWDRAVSERLCNREPEEASTCDHGNNMAGDRVVVLLRKHARVSIVRVHNSRRGFFEPVYRRVLRLREPDTGNSRNVPVLFGSLVDSGVDRELIASVLRPVSGWKRQSSSRWRRVPSPLSERVHVRVVPVRSPVWSRPVGGRDPIVRHDEDGHRWVYPRGAGDRRPLSQGLHVQQTAAGIVRRVRSRGDRRAVPSGRYVPRVLLAPVRSGGVPAARTELRGRVHEGTEDRPLGRRLRRLQGRSGSVRSA